MTDHCNISICALTSFFSTNMMLIIGRQQEHAIHFFSCGAMAASDMDLSDNDMAKLESFADDLNEGDRFKFLLDNVCTDASNERFPPPLPFTSFPGGMESEMLSTGLSFDQFGSDLGFDIARDIETQIHSQAKQPLPESKLFLPDREFPFPFSSTAIFEMQQRPGTSLMKEEHTVVGRKKGTHVRSRAPPFPHPHPSLPCV